jgi:hypothetical protein
VLPETDSISPVKCASPLCGPDEVVGGAAVVVALELGAVDDDDGGLAVFELHAAMDSAVAPATANIANRARRGLCKVAGINDFSNSK